MYVYVFLINYGKLSDYYLLAFSVLGKRYIKVNLITIDCKLSFNKRRKKTTDQTFSMSQSSKQKE